MSTLLQGEVETLFFKRSDSGVFVIFVFKNALQLLKPEN